jgi:hypothetical protein
MPPNSSLPCPARRALLISSRARAALFPTPIASHPHRHRAQVAAI